MHPGPYGHRVLGASVEGGICQRSLPRSSSPVGLAQSRPTTSLPGAVALARRRVCCTLFAPRLPPPTSTYRFDRFSSRWQVSVPTRPRQSLALGARGASDGAGLPHRLSRRRHRVPAAPQAERQHPAQLGTGVVGAAVAATDGDARPEFPPRPSFRPGTVVSRRTSGRAVVRWCGRCCCSVRGRLPTFDSIVATFGVSTGCSFNSFTVWVLE